MITTAFRPASLILGVALVLGVATGCKSSPRGSQPQVATEVLVPALALRPANEVRPQLVASAGIVAPAQIKGTLDGLSQRLQLPFALGSLAIDRLGEYAQLGFGAEHLARLASDAHIGVAIVGLHPGAEPEACVALTFQDAAGARLALEALGPETKKQQGVSVRTTGAEVTVAGALVGNKLLLASSPEVVLAAGSLALEAQDRPFEGLASLTLFPDGLARAKGTTVAAYVAGMEKQLETSLAAAQTGGKGQTQELTPAMHRMFPSLMRVVGGYLGDVAAARFTLDGGSARGISLQAEITPRPDTALAARTAQRAPYRLDPLLPVGGSATMVAAVGSLSIMSELVRAIYAAEPRTLAAYEQFLGITTGEGSCSFQFASVPLAMTCAMSLKPEITENQALDQASAFYEANTVFEKALLGKAAGTSKVRRTKTGLQIDRKMNLKAASPDQQRAIKMMGGAIQSYAVAVKDGRLITVSGKAPAAQLAALTPTRAEVPALTSVLEQTRERDALVYFDLFALTASLLQQADDPQSRQARLMMGALPGLDQVQAPIVLTMAGGPASTGELWIPFSSLESVVKVLRPFLGLPGGGAPAATTP